MYRKVEVTDGKIICANAYINLEHKSAYEMSLINTLLEIPQACLEGTW